jgi:hypothetical protein
VTVSVATFDGPATAPTDYTPVQITLILQPGQTTQTIDALVNGDTLDESDEVFFVTLSGGVNATIARGQGIGTILDDDTAGVVQFLSPTFSVDEDAGVALITVVRTGGSDIGLTVPFSASDGSATAGLDYSPVSGTLSFAPGQTTSTFAVPILDDFRIEGGETVLLTLIDPAVSGPGTSIRTAVLTIVEDDSLVVTSTNDTGRGSLRRIIQTSNDPGNPLLSTISFAIPGAGVQTIQPLSPLRRSHVRRSLTPPLSRASPACQSSRSMASGAGVSANGLTIISGGSTVSGLVINRFAGNGIVLLTNGGNTIQGNFVGTDASGSADMGNGGDGVLILDSPGNLIGGTTPGSGNVISGNGDVQNEAAGINISGRLASGNRVQGNRIGTNAAGTRALGNSSHGVFVSAPGNLIGGTEPGAGNVISGNGLRRLGGEDGVGIYLFSGGGNTIRAT